MENGLYEQIINSEIEKMLIKSTDKITKINDIDKAEASKILSKYTADIIKKVLDEIGNHIPDQINIVNQIIRTIGQKLSESNADEYLVSNSAKQLSAFFDKKNNVLANVIRPTTSIAQSSLFTGAIHEPQLYLELKKEIASSDYIDMLVSFIKWSGLRLIINELSVFTRNGGRLRIITTSYMGATDVKAIEELRTLPNTTIKISYDTKMTRLHAKTYVFYRKTGFSTAYVGSSNLSNAAISSGLEWNVKVAQKDQPETMDKIRATFESYWNSKEFEFYSECEKKRLSKALKNEKFSDTNNAPFFSFDIIPYSYQQEILDKLDAERYVRGYNKNLVVAATGTGKTVISAFDYKRFVKSHSNSHCRLLFIAHREEILKQSLFTFRGILKDNNFGEMFVGNYVPDSIDYLFMSIQTFNSQNFAEKTSPDFYDYIVVDEFHHAAAPSYERLLNHFTPKILLGLTATPERMDEKNIVAYFDNRIAAEIRLPEAIERKLLCPFQYFGVSDTVDLNELKWTRGGYDKGELSRIYSLSGKIAVERANMIVQSVVKYVTDINTVCGLGFCVSIEHAAFMSNHFTGHGIPSMCLTGKSGDDERKNAKQLLVSGKIKFIFAVDIYNEGVDIPEINTVLFLRPTESLTIFLQQLGRGLRLSEDKDCLTVLDFIGQSNKKYKFEEKFQALLSDSEKSIQNEIERGFVSLPKGCYIQLEKKAKHIILENIKASYNSRTGLVLAIKSFNEDSGMDLSLENFLNYYHMDVKSIYKNDIFSRLCACAGIRGNFSEPLEKIMTKAFQRFTYIDSRRLIKFFIEILTNNKRQYDKSEIRMLQIFHYTIWQKSIKECNFTNIYDGVIHVKGNKVLCQELIELLKYKYNTIDFIDEKVDFGFNCPLDLHCNYTRDQILVAMDCLNPSTLQAGVKYFKQYNTEIFLVTLNKADKDYSPTTMYKDYSINEKLFHWQSQSSTSDKSDTGKRYINQRENGTKIMIFVREFKKDPIMRAASPYTFLGSANYISHEGSKPINIVWELDKPIPSKFVKKTNKLLVV